MNSSFDRFGNLKALRATPRREGKQERGVIPDLPEGSARLAELLGASVERNRFGEHLYLRRWFSEPSGCQALPSSLRLLSPGAPEEAADPERWLFLDTETTGMAGGTGTYAFLVGVAWWDAGGLEVEQFFMRDYSEEHSVLLALSERLAERRILVTFNGKTFDWPLLETRYRMTRSISPRSPRAHFDLLHPARQLWRLRLGSVRLVELERRVLGWDRGTDVMSELIPQMYFDFVRGGPAEPLAVVFRHNQMDLRGLGALAGRIFSLLDAPELAERDPLELYGISRLLERRGEWQRARSLFERALDGELPREADRIARRELARLAKRDGDFLTATALWHELCQDPPESFDAHEELAIYYEHRARQPQRAADLARQALAELDRAGRAGLIAPGRCRRLRGKLEHRLARLERKIQKLALHLLETSIPESRAGAPESNSDQLLAGRNSPRVPDGDAASDSGRLKTGGRTHGIDRR